MSTDLMPFDYEGQTVRTVIVDGEPRFVLADLCTVLGLSNPTVVAQRIDPDALTRSEVIDSMGRTQSAAVVNEAGMYEVVIRSDKPRAVSFRRWIAGTVLPAIRKTGSFTVETREQLLARAVLEATAAIAEKDQRIAELAPKAEAFADLMDANGLYTMEAAAKALGWGRNVLFRDLRRMGILQGNNLPYQRHMHHFDVKVATYVNRKTGETCPTATTYVRPTGLDWLRRRLLQSPTLIGADS